MCLIIQLTPDNRKYIDHVLEKGNADYASIIDNRLALIAMEDIEVFKNLKVSWVLFVRNLYAPYRGTPYRQYKRYKSTFRIKKEFGGQYAVEDGLHAWATEDKAREKREELQTFRAVIPAGSRYFIGERGDIVADQLIVKRRIK